MNPPVAEPAHWSDQPQSLAGLFESCAARFPGRVAAEDPSGRRLTYAELDAASSRLADLLSRRGVKRGDRVGICLPKGLNSLTCVLGILKARAAYVPVDYSAPADRNSFIFKNCQARVVCTDEPRRARLSAGWTDAPPMLVFPGGGADGVGAPWLDEGSPSWRHADPAAAADLSYILYTSGSTGLPKGVMHTNASALSFVRWCRDVFRPTAEDRFSSHAPFHFDLSILDLYVPMTAGAAVVIVTEDLGKDPHALAPFIADAKISVWYSVPSILALLAQYGKLETRDYSRLRTVLFAGEVFPVKHLRDLTRLWPGRGYYNLYGPTETNVCTYFKVPDQIDPAREIPFPIGKTCANCRDLVLDESGRPVDGPSEGVLYMHQSGPVMLGYWGDEDRTKKSFHVDASGERWYCTGDVVHKDAAGDYVFVGRRDRMVKRRGYRIELGEIEAAVYKHADVREAAAIASSNAEGVTISVFLSAKEGKKLSIIALKQHGMATLPSYMIPDRFVVLEKLPRTSTDKVDYQSLVKMAT